MKFFHTFEYRCEYDINFEIVAKNEQVNLPITHGYKCFKSEFYGLN